MANTKAVKVPVDYLDLGTMAHKAMNGRDGIAVLTDQIQAGERSPYVHFTAILDTGEVVRITVQRKVASGN